MKEDKQARSIQISGKAMTVSTVMVTLVLIVSVILSLVMSPGVIETAPDGSLKLLPGENRMTLWKYILSPLLVLTPIYDNFVTVWSIVLLCVVIGAVFSAMDACGILVYMVESLGRRFGSSKYRLLFVLSLVMMFLGTTLGIAEEVVPLVPLAVMLFYALGWDSPLAVMSSDLAACAGFTVGVINPFNTGLAQSLSDEVSMYSGVLFRLVLFAAFYGVLWFWLRRYAKRLDADPAVSCTYEDDLKYTLYLGTVSRNQCGALLPTYMKQVADAQSLLTNWHEKNVSRLGIDTSESKRKRAGFDYALHWIPGRFNDDFNFRPVAEKTVKMIETQASGSSNAHSVAKDSLYDNDVRLISKDGKIYYLPENNSTESNNDATTE